MDKKLLKKLLIIVGTFLGALIIFIIITSLIRGINNKKNPYEKIRSNAVDAAYKYYDSLEQKLNSGESLEVSYNDLVSKKYMKDYKSKLNDGVKCTGKVIISNNFDNILYTSILDCGKEYKSETLYDHIINNNEIVSSGDGLYDLYNRYIYRGEEVNNYLEFDNKVWYIVDIEKNGTIRLLDSTTAYDYEIAWDDRYNVTEGYTAGYNDFLKSRINETLTKLAKDNDIISLSAKKHVLPQDVCIGKRNQNSKDNSNTTECSETVKGQLFSTLTPSDIINVSIDPYCNSIDQNQCSNYNYLYNREIFNFWTLTADPSNNHTVYYSSNGILQTIDTYEYKKLYVTIKLPSETLYASGNGSEDNPYRIVEN